MNRLLAHSALFVLLLAVALSGNSLLMAQEQPAAPGGQSMTAEEFTNYLKTIWSFLKAETEQYQAAVGTKSEFETTKEFEQRTIERRQQYLANITKYSQDQKIGGRTVVVYFKAILHSYNADRKVYSLHSGTVIDAPYNIPTVRCTVPKNPYVALADSVRAGYRTSVLHLTVEPEFQWQVTRDVAQAAKQSEGAMFFEVSLVVDIESNDGRSEAKLQIVPKQFSLVNKETNQVFLSRKIF